MIKKIKLSFLAIITAFFFSTPVVAEEHSSYSISGNTVTFASALSDGDVVVARYQR